MLMKVLLYCQGNYSPRNWIAIPEKKIIDPAIRWLYFSTGFRLILLRPILKAKTIDIIVAIVTTEKRTETRMAPPILLSAAGYMRIGISGSQGPKTKIRKSIHGVVETPSFS